jgi:hypothetical protein
MPELLTDNAQLVRDCDLACRFADSQLGASTWRYRFVPPKHLCNLDIASERGLEQLLYLLTLINDEID